MIAAIMGAHTIGSAKKQNSGYEGFWDDAEETGIFNNHYYKVAAGSGWVPEPSVAGNKDKN